MPTEQQIKNREIAAAGGTPIEPTDTNVTTPTSGFDQDFFTRLSQQLLGDNSVSSQQSQLEKTLTDSKTAIEQGRAAGEQRIESTYDRYISEAGKSGAQTYTSAQEAQRGFGTNRAMLAQIKKDTETRINDLEDRRQTLLLEGDATAASQVAKLQLEEWKFEQQARQQAITNMFSLAGLGLQQKAAETQISQFEANQKLQREQMQDTKDKFMQGIMVEYGVTGDTLDDVLANAAKVSKGKRDADLRLIEKKMGEINKAEERINLNAELWRNIEDGLSPEESADMAFAYGKAIGYDLDNVDGTLLRMQAIDYAEKKRLQDENDRLTTEKEMNDAVGWWTSQVDSTPFSGSGAPGAVSSTAGRGSDKTTKTQVPMDNFAEARKAFLDQTEGDIYSNLLEE